MDLYHFIDSHAIRKHLQSLSYPFTTQEVAFLVCYCKTATLEEKHAAWREIMDTMPNCSLEKRLNMEPIPDFHQFLRDFIHIERRELESFRSADQCVYFYCPSTPVSWRSVPMARTAAMNAAWKQPLRTWKQARMAWIRFAWRSTASTKLLSDRTTARSTQTAMC